MQPNPRALRLRKLRKPLVRNTIKKNIKYWVKPKQNNVEGWKYNIWKTEGSRTTFSWTRGYTFRRFPVQLPSEFWLSRGATPQHSRSCTSIDENGHLPKKHVPCTNVSNNECSQIQQRYGCENKKTVGAKHKRRVSNTGSSRNRNKWEARNTMYGGLRHVERPWSWTRGYAFRRSPVQPVSELWLPRTATVLCAKLHIGSIFKISINWPRRKMPHLGGCLS